MVFQKAWAQTFFSPSIAVLHVDIVPPNHQVLETHYYFNLQPWFKQLVFTTDLNGLGEITSLDTSLILLKDDKGIRFIMHSKKGQIAAAHFLLKPEDISDELASCFPQYGYTISDKIESLPRQYQKSSIIKMQGAGIEHLNWDAHLYAEAKKMLDDGRLNSLILSPQELKLFDQTTEFSWKFLESFLLGFNPETANLKDWILYFACMRFLMFPVRNLIRLLTEYLLCVIKLSLEDKNSSILNGLLKLVNLVYLITRLVGSPHQLMAEYQFRDGEALPSWKSGLVGVIAGAQIGLMLSLGIILFGLDPVFLFIGLGLIGESLRLYQDTMSYIATIRDQFGFSHGNLQACLVEAWKEENLNRGLSIALDALSSSEECKPILVYPNTRFKMLEGTQTQWTSSPPLGPLAPNTWYFYPLPRLSIRGVHSDSKDLSVSEILVYPSGDGEALFERYHRYDVFKQAYTLKNEEIMGLQGVFHGRYSYVYQDRKPEFLESKTVYVYPGETGLRCIGNTTDMIGRNKISEIDLDQHVRSTHHRAGEWRCLMTNTLGQWAKDFSLFEKCPGKKPAINTNAKFEVTLASPRS